MELKGKKVLVTGANRGIGLALAKAFVDQGAEVFMGMRRPDQDLASSFGAQAVEVDLSSRESLEKCLPVVQALELDVLVNNAGLLTGGLLEKQPLDDVYQMYQVNLVGLTHLTMGILPGMLQRKRGKIVMNASISGVMRFPCANTYAAAKAGVVALTECLENELGGTGVSTLILITPGVKTRMFDDIPNKYGENLDLSFTTGAIPAEEWATRVVRAVQSDIKRLNPGGATGLGVFISQHIPALFSALVKSRFSR